MLNKPVSNETLLQQLRWRYAVKKFDPTRKISALDWQTLEEALVLSPSSYGLQPWKFIVVTRPKTREELLPVSWNQAQVVDCSHLVVFAIKKHFGLKQVDDFVQRMAEVRGVPVEALAAYRGYIVQDIIEGIRSHQVNAWSTCQVYIALGNFMTSAAMLGIDTCPMEGIEPDKYDQILGLARRDLGAVVACAAGYRAADDKYATLPKVRFKAEHVIERIQREE